MIFLLSDAKEFCAEFVKEGRHPDSNDVLNAINEATRILLNEGDWKNTKRIIRLRIMNNCVALPENVECILKVNFGRSRGHVWSQAYEFMDGGPGLVRAWDDSLFKDLIDEGDGYPTFFPVGPYPLYVAAFSTAAADTSKTIRLRGFDSNGHEIAPTAPGETLQINQWKDGEEGVVAGTYVYSSYLFSEISQVVKEETTGYISLMAVDRDENRWWNLSKYGPYETQPGYRRYRITGTHYDTEEYLMCLVKMRYVPLRHADDVLPIQNLEALKLMCKALYQFDRGDPQRGLIYQAKAVRMLDQQLKNSYQGERNIDADTELSFGSIEGII